MPKPLPFSDAPGRFEVTLTPSYYALKRVVIELAAGATWDDYFDAIAKAADVPIGSDGWLVYGHKPLPATSAEKGRPAE